MRELSIPAKMRIKNVIVAFIATSIFIAIVLLTSGCAEKLCPAYY